MLSSPICANNLAIAYWLSPSIRVFAKRAERLGQRPVRPLTPAEIKERDRTEVENIGKAPPIALADCHFVNDGDLGQLNDFADGIVAKTR